MTVADFEFHTPAASVYFAGGSLAIAEPGEKCDIDLSQKAAVNLASALLQWATQNRSPVPPPPPATPAVLPRKER